MNIEHIVKTFGNELAMHLTPSNEAMKAVRFAREVLTDVSTTLQAEHEREMGELFDKVLAILNEKTPVEHEWYIAEVEALKTIATRRGLLGKE